MATTLDSRRSVPALAVAGAGASADPTSGNRNKTSTICFNLGLIFRRTPHFFCPLQERLHTLFRIGRRARFEV